LLSSTIKMFAEAVGNVNLKLVPVPYSLSTHIFPPCFSIISFTKDKPKPLPFSPLVPSEVNFVSTLKSLLTFSCLIPFPVSLMENSKNLVVPDGLTETSILSSLLVNLIAFDSRLLKTCSIKSLSTKDRFISIISHDLRTPFSSILGFTELLSNDETLSKDERSQYISFIKESSNAMLSLVNSLLDWTRLQTGRMKFEPQKIQADTVIEKSINTLSGMSFQKGINVISNVGNDHFVFVDNDLIEQVFNNLLSNAIKFTSKDDKVEVSVKPSGTTRFLEFSIKDTGKGIKQENISKLFSVDTKFTSEGTSGEKGSGLGLSLVKDIIEKHGGKIWVESEYGTGTDFKFTLPTASANILIIDDNKTDRLLYSKILNNITPEYNVEVASNGKEALENIAVSPPALVITEHQMPEMNGYEFVQELIKANLANTLPVLVLSRKVERNVAQDYLELGIEFVFQKPVNLQSFKKSIEKSLRKGISANNSK